MPVAEAEAPAARNDHDKFHALIAKAQTHPAVKVAVAHPCDEVSLETAILIDHKDHSSALIRVP